MMKQLIHMHWCIFYNANHTGCHNIRPTLFSFKMYVWSEIFYCRLKCTTWTSLTDDDDDVVHFGESGLWQTDVFLLVVIVEGVHRLLVLAVHPALFTGTQRQNNRRQTYNIFRNNGWIMKLKRRKWLNVNTDTVSWFPLRDWSRFECRRFFF